ncbi:MAG: cation:proton antiporter [Desulfurivibrio sp.]|nr:cation:proton antiporter [Desulfurivibrio sp.]
MDELLSFVTPLALSVIAFIIGSSLQLTSIKALGRSILVITVAQATGALLLVTATFYALPLLLPQLQGYGNDLIFSAGLVLGAISAATAPAAVLAIIHELRAQGPLTTTLLGVVAIDDALTVLLFSAALTVTTSLLPEANPDAGHLLDAVWEIGGALAAGAGGGYLLSRFWRREKRAEITLVITLGIILLVAGLALQLHWSYILALMMMGFTIGNLKRVSNDKFHQLSTLEEPLYCLFFALAGAHFDLTVLPGSLLLGAALLAGRLAGKLGGTYLGASLTPTPTVVRKYLGSTLLPQAGLALGLIFLTRPYFPEPLYHIMLNGMLASIILNELGTPLMVKWALGQAGEGKTT